jgi:Na+(H+)/acetate symporter ActP
MRACDGRTGLEKGLHPAHIQRMVLNVFKIAALAGLTVVVLGIFPNRMTGAIIAIGTCVAAALVLHFVAP